MAARKPPPDPVDRDQLVLDYLPLVSYVLGRLAIHVPPTVDREDLFSAGVIGLLHAARNYDPTRGASFKTFAYTHIRGAILDELRRVDFIPRTQRERMKQFNEARENLEVKLGRPPRADEIAREMGVSPEEVDDILWVIRGLTWLSLDEQVGHDRAEGASHLLAHPRASNPADVYERKELLELTKEAIRKLSPQERQVILLYYERGLLLREIGEILGVSESRVSQIHSRALFHLNQELERRQRVRPGRVP